MGSWRGIVRCRDGGAPLPLRLGGIAAKSRCPLPMGEGNWRFLYGISFGFRPGRAGEWVCEAVHAQSLDGELSPADDGGGCNDRSEEHTSELQSLMRSSYAVFCLKKKRQNPTGSNTQRNKGLRPVTCTQAL